MSSDDLEVAELAKAINSHAEVLYESWKTNSSSNGPSNTDNNIQQHNNIIEPSPSSSSSSSSIYQRPLYDIAALKRMEDTLQLLADPDLTPKLEHYVSNFVRRDKAKRQQYSPIDTNNSRRSASPVKIIPIEKESNGSGGNNNNNNPKKPLPKSILAAVQRFEPAAAPTSEQQQQLDHRKSHERSRSPAAAAGLIMPGIGSISRDVVTTESGRFAEKNFRVKSPLRSIVNNSNDLSSSISTINGPNDRNDGPSSNNTNNYHYERQVHKSNSKTSVLSNNNNNNSREIHIPIERIDENGARSKIVNGNNTNSESMTSRSRTSPSRRQFNGISDDLEREEEKLVNALRTGQVLTSSTKSPFNKSQPGTAKSMDNNIVRGQSPVQHFRHHYIEREGHSPSPGSSYDGTSPTNSSINLTNGNNNTNSRIAFAKERIRHSQEHPLTQQRLELQKQLPSPSSNLAAAIAVQQGKIKFQPHNHQTRHYPPHESHQHGHFHPRLENQNSRESGNNGRQNWVSNIKFGQGGSSSVAERVQLFEKYPAYVPMGNHSSSQQQHSPPFSRGQHRAASPRISRTIDEPRLTRSEAYYSSPSTPVSIPINRQQHSPKEITHLIRTDPEQINPLNLGNDKMTLSPKLHPLKSEIKIVHHNHKQNLSNERGDHHSAVENSFTPWRHSSSSANKQEIQTSVQNSLENIQVNNYINL